MDFALQCPEVSSGLMYAGPGAGPMLAAGAAWDSVAAQLESAAGGYFSEVSGLTGQAWFGPSSMRMATAAVPYIAWLQAGAAQAAQTSAQAYAAAAAYEAAFAMTVPPPVIAANRSLKMALIATNFFGQNTPAIAATEAQYMEMWVQDATTMYTYAADSSVASTLTPHTEPPQTTNESGQLSQSRALAQTTANNAGARTQSLVQMTQPATAQQLSSAVGGDPVLGPGSYGAGTYANGTVVVGPQGLLYISQGGSLITPNEAQAVVVNGTLFINTNGTLALGPGSTFVDQGVAQISAGGSTTTLANSTVTVGTSGVFQSFGEMTITDSVINLGAGGHFVNGFGSTATVVNSIVTTGGSGGFAVQTGHTVAISSGTVTGTAGTDYVIMQPTAITANVVPVTPNALALGEPAASALSSSPGLAGTVGIQPQLSVDWLLEWARTVSGADLAAGLAGGAG